MSDDLSTLVASADRRRRVAIMVFLVAVGIAALFPRNDRAMWTPEADTPFVFTAVPEKLPVVYLTLGGADALVRQFIGLGNDNRKRRSRFIPIDTADLAPAPGQGRAARGNIPEASVPRFGELPTELADARSAPGGTLNPGSGVPGGGTGGGGDATGGGSGGGSSGGGFGGGSGGGGGTPGTIIPTNPDDPSDPTDPIPEVPPVMSPVPEPMTWAMFIAGFLMVGGALRLRRKRQILA